MTELREKVARIVVQAKAFQLDSASVTDAILDLPEIKEALEALERERELDKKLGHKV